MQSFSVKKISYNAEITLIFVVYHVEWDMSHDLEFSTEVSMAQLWVIAHPTE
jgi:hypothetical protein